MRRALPAAGLTAAALIMLSRFHSMPETGVTKLRPARPASQSAPDTTPSAGPSPAPVSGNGAPADPRSTTTSSGTTPASTVHDGTFTGAEIQTRWGPVQVQIVVKGGKVTDVQEVEAPDSHDRSVEINDEAAPILRDEALKAQSADLDLVSGATITWDGYRQSLQAALDLARR